MSIRVLMIAWIAVFIATPYAFAIDPPPPEHRQGLRDDASLRSIFFVDAKQGWAVGDRGVIWYTPDGGEHWLSQESGVGCRLDSVNFVNAREGWAAGGWYDPDTQISRGVLLRTRDGGQTWELITNELPRIRTIQFNNNREGIAGGDWSAVHLGSVFLTYDGGSTWQRAPHCDAGPTIAMRHAGSLVSLDRSGVVHWAAHPESPSARALANVRLTAIGTGNNEQCLVGLDGAIFSSRNGGRSWMPIDPLAAGSVVEAYNLNCVAGAGETFWMAGTPGDRIFVKNLAGSIAHAPTGITAPIHALHFVDANHGWAACSMGTILHSSDGGRSWQPQRAAHRHAATLYVSREASALPWSVIASESLEKGFRAIAAIERPAKIALTDPMTPHAIDTTCQSFSRVGGCDVLLVPNPDHPAYEAALHRILRAAGPSVVVLNDDLTRDQSAAWLRASTSTSSVARVFRAFPGERGDVVTHPAAILPAAGEVVTDAWADALAVVAPGLASSNVIACDRLLEREPTVRPLESLHHRLPIGAGGNARRMPPNGNRSQLGSLGPRTRHSEWVKQLIDTTSVATDPSKLFRSRLQLLSEQIRPSDRPRFMRRLILACREADDAGMYRLAISATANTVPESPIGAWAALVNASVNASEEWTRLPSTPISHARQAITAARSSPTAHGSPFAPASPIVQASLDNSQGQRTIQDVPTTESSWQHHPARLVAQFSQLGERAEPSLVAAMGRLAGAQSAGVWQQMAKWQTVTRSGAPIQNATYQAAFTPMKPFLDGEISEALWQRNVSEQQSTIRFAYDKRYVYIAITGGLANYRAIREIPNRQRDAELDGSERISIEIDVDGDLLTRYRLELDAAGRCRDSCDGFTQWNPIWFVKTSDASGIWTAELAIRRDDLFGLPVAPGDAWHVRVRTLNAKESRDNSLLTNPQGWGLLSFQ